MFLLGYDIGSSSIKAALVDVKTNQTLHVAQYPDNELDMLSRKSGWAEQQPEVWWQALCNATRRLLSKSGVDPSSIKGICIAYQMHGLVLIDQQQQVLRPSIIWCDSRAVPIGNKAFEEIGSKVCLTHLLNSPGNFTASKLKWVMDNEPDIYRNTYKILLPGDYIAMKLTGNISTTISGLSESILWDFKEKKVSQKVLDYYGIDSDLIPDILPTFSQQGELTKEAAEMTGLALGTAVTYRAGDQPNNALSLNVLNPGEIAATSGTSGVVYGIVDRPIYDTKSRVNAFAHVNYEDNFDRIGILLCLNGAGIQYSWMKQQVALGETSYSDMERMATSVPIGSDGLCILPFGNGAERMLENNNINSHIFNLEFNRHHRAHFYRAALEGVAFSFVHGVNILMELGLNVDVMRVSNDNMFRSEVFSMTIATLLDCHIEVVDTTGAVGAARASGVASKIYDSVEDAFSGIQPNLMYEPRLNHALCSQAYAYWSSCLSKALSKTPVPGMDLSSKYESIKETLAAKNKEITSTNMHLLSKSDLLKEVQSDIENLAKKEPSLVHQLSRIVNKIEGKIDDEKEWGEFEEHFDLVHSDFFKTLKESYPTITLPEVKLCSLLKMRLSTKEIAHRLNLSVRGVETRRYRLRKKMLLQKGEDLESLFEQLLV